MQLDAMGLLEGLLPGTGPPCAAAFAEPLTPGTWLEGSGELGALGGGWPAGKPQAAGGQDAVRDCNKF